MHHCSRQEFCLSSILQSAYPFIAAIALLLMFVGIHNAWDTVTYIAVQRRKEQEKEQETKTKKK